MPAPVSPDTQSIVTRLRAAGCVFAEDEARLLMSAATTPAGLMAMVDRRAAGEPLEHVVGWAEFCGLRIAVDPGVFVPRRRTEFLVHQAIGLAGQADAAVPNGELTTGGEDQTRQPGPSLRTPPRQLSPGEHTSHTRHPGSADGAPLVVVDLCCGSGAVGAALAAALGPVELHAADLDPVAVRCARRNVADAGGRVYQGDLFDPLPAELRGRVTILVANAPYVPSGEVTLLPPEARIHEPLVALDGGGDGLDILRRVAGAAPDWLAPRGHLLVETSERQAPQLTEAMARAGLVPRVARSDELNATVIIAAAPG